MKLHHYSNLVLTSLIITLLLTFGLAYGQMSRGSVENAVNQEGFENCEFLSIQDGVDTPVRLAITFPSTPNVLPEIHGESVDSVFSSDFTNEAFFFQTNATDLWTITLHVDYENPSSEPRNFFYEIFTSPENKQKQVGNWQETTQNFCLIMELNAKPAPHIKTDDEIIATIAEHELERDLNTQGLIQAVLDIIAVIVIAVVGIGIIFLTIMYFMKMSKSKDSANHTLVTKQFSNTVDKIGKLTKYLKSNDFYRDVKIDYVLANVRQSLKDLMHGSNLLAKSTTESAFRVHKPLMTTKEDKVTDGISFLGKVTDTLKDQFEVGSKKLKKVDDSLYSKLDEKTTDDLYDILIKMEKEIEKDKEKYYKDLEFKEKFDTLHVILKKRTEP